MKKTDLYLVYGSNLNLHQVKFRCSTAKVIGSAILEDYKMVFRGAQRSGVATIEKCKGFKVPVLIWEITPSDEKINFAWVLFVGVTLMGFTEKRSRAFHD